MSKNFLLILLAILGSHSSLAQEYYDRDSLWTEMKTAKEDTNKVWLYIKLGQQYETNNPDSALILYRSALTLSEKLRYTRGIISYYTNATYVYNLTGMLDTALVLNLRSVEIARKFGDPERLAACLGNVGASYMQLDQPEKAIEYNLQIVPLLENIPPSVNNGVLYQNLCVLYNDINQFEKAQEFGLKALAIFRQFNNEYGIANMLNNLAISDISLGRYDEAKKFLKQAEVIAGRTNNQFIIMSALLNRVDIEIQEGHFAMIEGDCEKALALSIKLSDPISEGIAARGLAIYYLSMNNVGKAENYARRSISVLLENNSIKQAGKSYGTLASILILKKDFQGYNTYSAKSDSIRNLLLNESIAKNIQNIEAKYESEKKEQRIKELQQQAEIHELSIERNKLLNAALIGSLISITLITLLTRYNYQQKKRLLTEHNRFQEMRITQLETEKQVLAGEAVIRGQEEERGRLAKDLHDGLGGMLSGVKFSLSKVRSNVVLDQDNTLIFERSIDMLDHSISELRRVAHNMMPEVLVRFGLSEALKSYCESLRASKIFKVDYQSVGITERLPEKTEIFIFRIAQELLNNVAKHAQASHVLVQLARNNDEVSITIEDNGIGFDAPAATSTKGAGLSSIRSRVDYLKGKLDIQSEPGQGTSVHIIIPLP